MQEEVSNQQSTVNSSESRTPSPEPRAPSPLDLSAPIRIEFKHRGIPLAHVLNRPGQRDWLNYAKGVSTTYEFAGEGIHAEISGELEAQGKLWRASIRSVEGYGGADGRAIAEVYPDVWREKIPASHVELAVRALAAVRVKTAEDPALTNPVAFILDLESQAVELEMDGVAHAPLVHHFRIPTLNEFAKFRRLMADSRLVGGTRHLKTIMFSRLPGLVKLYDELIISIEGYKAGQSPIDNRQSTIEQMDAIHKQVAVQGLFEPPTEQSAVSHQPSAEDEGR
jgi:hypothetical protein